LKRPLLSHIDLRVRDKARAVAFYDKVLGALGFTRDDGDEWTSYHDTSATRRGPEDFEWFGFTEEPDARPNSNRIGFVAMSNDEVDQVAAILRELGMHVEGPNYDEGPGYYGVFFADPDGNLLEVCCRIQ